MSYSFSVRAASKAAAIALIASKLADVEAQQASHAVDKKQALSAAESFVNLLPDDGSKDVVATVNGSVCGTWAGGALERLTSASLTVTAGLADPQPQA